MFVSHRRASLGERGAFLEAHSLVHSRYKLRHVSSDGAVDDRQLYRPALTTRPARAGLELVLRGEAFVGASGRGHWLGPGEAGVVSSKQGLVRRRSRSGEPYAGLSLEWDADLLPGQPAVAFAIDSVGTGSLSRISQAATRLTSPWCTVEDGARVAATVLQELSHEGADLAPREASDLVEPTAAGVRAASFALDEVMNELHHDGELDEQLKAASKHIVPVLSSLEHRYGVEAVAWADKKARRRLEVASMLLEAHRDAEQVAGVVGYRSGEALRAALAAVGGGVRER